MIYRYRKPPKWMQEIGRKIDLELDGGERVESKIRSLPWQLGSGQWVVLVEGKVGGWAIERVHKYTPKPVIVNFEIKDALDTLPNNCHIKLCGMAAYKTFENVFLCLEHINEAKAKGGLNGILHYNNRPIAGEEKGGEDGVHGMEHVVVSEQDPG